jgi:hypothetical protein
MLQELVAPASSIFYNHEWQEIGMKASLKNNLSYIMGVPPDILRGSNWLGAITVAKKMSWVSNRVTMKGEDLAYSLMVFNVNMLILYGEGGEKAFARLQQEIWKVAEDPSIFAWVGKDGAAKQGLLVHNLVEFACTGNVQLDLDGFYKSFNISSMLSHSYMTNCGLLITIPLQCPSATMLDSLLGLFTHPSHASKHLSMQPCLAKSMTNFSLFHCWQRKKGISMSGSSLIILNILVPTF